MRKIGILLLAAMCAGAVWGQNKRVAVANPIATAGVNLLDISIVRGQLETYIDAMQDYEKVTRDKIYIDLISKEMAFERSGMVNDADRKKLGVLKGADIIVVSKLTYGKGGYLNVEAKFIHVETGQIEKSVSLVMNRNNPKEMETSCKALAEKLTGVSITDNNSGEMETACKDSAEKRTGASITEGETSGGETIVPPGKNRSFTVNGVTFEMVFVEGENFVMGCTPEQGDCGYGNKKTTLRVTLSDFYIGKYPVTQKLWQAVMGVNIRQQRDLADTSAPLMGEGPDYPMYYISYNDCEKFCAKLNQLLSKSLPKGYTFTLPTEAQWEYAARGGLKSAGYKYSGGNDIDQVAWYDGNSGRKTHEVGKKNRNELGIYDMSGNVLEWCYDWYDEYKYSYKALINPKGPSSPPTDNRYRVMRGGSCVYSANSCCVSSRSSRGELDYHSIYEWSTYGFRLSLDLDELRKKKIAENKRRDVLINGVRWATRNVGAPGTFVEKPTDAGMFYQWNSKTGWSSTDPFVSTDGSAWNDSWRGNGATTWEIANNVCPAGYRIPTYDELKKLDDASSEWTTINGIVGRVFYGNANNFIFLPAAGYRKYKGLEYYGKEGTYWSNTTFNYGYSSSPFNFNFDDKDTYNSINTGRTSKDPSYGLSVRCVVANEAEQK